MLINSIKKKLIFFRSDSHDKISASVLRADGLTNLTPIKKSAVSQ